MNAIPRLVSDDGTEFIIDGGQVIGRSADCDIRLVSDRVSRQHARITATDDGAVIEDLGSANGTRVNGILLSEATKLMHGDTIAIDRFTLRVRLEDGAMEEGVTEIADAADVTVFDDGVGASGSAGDTPLPGSWVESGSGEHTEFFGSEGAGGAAAVERHSDLPHLLLLDDDGNVNEIFELDRSGAGDEQTWEIGREAECDLVIGDSTVSARHAQLFHRGDRWRLVNLVSSNGILVNGEKRLSVYLAGGDTIQLGRGRLVFFDDVAARPAGAGPARAAAEPSRDRGPGAGKWLLGGGALLLVLLVLAYLFWP